MTNIVTSKRTSKIERAARKALMDVLEAEGAPYAAMRADDIIEASEQVFYEIETDIGAGLKPDTAT